MIKTKENPKKKEKKKNKSVFVRLSILILVVYVASRLIDMQATLAERKQELEELNATVETQRIANKELERQLQMGMDEEYVERVARDKLDYVYPNERVIFDISGS